VYLINCNGVSRKCVLDLKLGSLTTPGEKIAQAFLVEDQVWQDTLGGKLKEVGFGDLKAHLSIFKVGEREWLLIQVADNDELLIPVVQYVEKQVLQLVDMYKPAFENPEENQSLIDNQVVTQIIGILKTVPCPFLKTVEKKLICTIDGNEKNEICTLPSMKRCEEKIKQYREKLDVKEKEPEGIDRLMKLFES